MSHFPPSRVLSNYHLDPRAVTQSGQVAVHKSRFWRSVSRPPARAVSTVGSLVRQWVALRDVQDAASHSDPRTTVRYDRARHSLDRHATYVVATFIATAST